ncbi:MAG: iron permease FTR1, partial [Dehalococcoidia bacterium]|nr:iron permease FTR1 [Dehalococcoidia bacterium]
MTAALAITLREGMEAALVLGIILAYLRRTGRTYLNKYVYWGLGFAVLVSILAGIVIQIIGLDPENEYVEGTLLSIGGVFVASMVIWMWKTAKNIRTHMETRMENIVKEEKTSRQTAIGLLAFTFFMVAREGVETVLFLAAATVGQEASVLNLLGGMLGIALAALFAVLFIRGSL